MKVWEEPALVDGSLSNDISNTVPFPRSEFSFPSISTGRDPPAISMTAKGVPWASHTPCGNRSDFHKIVLAASSSNPTANPGKHEGPGGNSPHRTNSPLVSRHWTTRAVSFLPVTGSRVMDSFAQSEDGGGDRDDDFLGDGGCLGTLGADHAGFARLRGHRWRGIVRGRRTNEALRGSIGPHRCSMAGLNLYILRNGQRDFSCARWLPLIRRLREGFLKGVKGGTCRKVLVPMTIPPPIPNAGQ